MTSFFDVLIGGVFHASVLFLVAAGLQLVFGVQRIVNLACGSFYALGAYFGISAVNWTSANGAPPWTFLPVLIVAGILLGAIGPFIERLLRTIYRRDEAFQLLLTFALVLMFQDVLRFFWGANPQQLGNLSMSYGKVTLGEVSFPTYNVLVMAASLGVAVGLGVFLRRTRYGRVLRATAENREMAEALGADVRGIYATVLPSAPSSARSAARWSCRPQRRRSTCRSSWSSRRSPSSSSAASAACAARLPAPSSSA